MLLVVGVLVAAGLVFGARWAGRVLTIGPAYKAKILASLVFGTDRTIDPNHVEEVSAELYWPMRLFRAKVDRTRQMVTASFFGFSPRRALYRDGFGATLLTRGATGVGAGLRPAATWREAARPNPARPEPRPTGVGAGLRPAGTARLERAVLAAFDEPDPRRLRRTRAVVVIHDGVIVAERYASGYGEQTRCPGWSMAKSVMNALAGILVREGRLALDDRALWPTWQPPDPRSAITVEDLLRMRSGLRFVEDYANLSSEVVQMLFNRADMAAFAAAQPLEHRPGTLWSYASGTTNILSAVMRRMLGDAEYAAFPRRALFDPLGMESAILERDAAGTFIGSSFMLATARDWGRFGQLFAQDGVWAGQRILPEEWIRFSTTPTPQSPGDIYGAHWWLRLKPEISGSSPAVERIPSDAFFAVGHEAQTLTIIPSARLVIVRLGVTIHIEAWNQAEFIASICDAL